MLEEIASLSTFADLVTVSSSFTIDWTGCKKNEVKQNERTEESNDFQKVSPLLEEISSSSVDICIDSVAQGSCSASMDFRTALKEIRQNE
jgi:hypothetical protein